jgi:hypothetical protein
VQKSRMNLLEALRPSFSPLKSSELCAKSNNEQHAILSSEMYERDKEEPRKAHDAPLPLLGLVEMIELGCPLHVSITLLHVATKAIEFESYCSLDDGVE